MKTFKEFISENVQDKLDGLPKGKIFDDAVDISGVFKNQTSLTMKS